MVSFIKLPQNTCQLGCSQIIINKIMTASVPPPPPPPPVCRILEGCQRYVLAVVCAHAHIPGSVSLHIWSSSSQVCVHCRRFLHVHTLTHTHKEKKTKPISLFQTHEWSSWGSLVQSKTTILRCRREPVESWNLSRRLLTWQRKTVGLARISIPLTSTDWVRPR